MSELSSFHDIIMKAGIMKVDSCIILAAGMGSRMGQIGQSLPKPLLALGKDRTFYQFYMSKLEMQV